MKLKLQTLAGNHQLQRRYFPLT